MWVGRAAETTVFLNGFPKSDIDQLMANLLLSAKQIVVCRSLPFSPDSCGLGHTLKGLMWRWWIGGLAAFNMMIAALQALGRGFGADPDKKI